MLPLQFVPKPYRGLALIAGAVVVYLTIKKLRTDIKLNEQKLEEYEENS